jgi:hypothetical protein
MNQAVQAAGSHSVAALTMPIYQCHKRVQALKIADVIVADAILVFEDQRFPELKVDPKLFARRLPEIGDYYVVYEDGYASISPAKSFEEGYTALKPELHLCSNPGKVIAKLEPGEPCFTLRGRDPLAHSVIMIWAADAEAAGVSREKVADARSIAARMNAWPAKRLPD